MKTALVSAALVATIAAFSAPAHAETFAGPYVRVTAGWERGEIADSIVSIQPIDANASRDALALGGYAGYNYRVAERFVIGAEAGFTATVDDRVHATSANEAVTIDPRYRFDLTTRTGYLVSEKALVYVRGGYANNRVRTALETAGGTVRESDNLDGWLVGGDVEYAISDRITARAEYRYSDFGSNASQYDRHQTLVGVSDNF